MADSRTSEMAASRGAITVEEAVDGEQIIPDGALDARLSLE